MAVNSDDKNNWRDKYLNALDAQDALEQRFAQQQEVLRRALVGVSVAADGQDEALDQIMAQLREKLRTATGSGTKNTLPTSDLEPLLSRLEQAAITFEEQREQSAQDIRQALCDTLKPLEQLKLSRGVKKDISQFLAQLPQRSKKVRLYPALLQQLASIQQQALHDIEQPQKTLLGKFLGGKAAPAPTSALLTEPKTSQHSAMFDDISLHPPHNHTHTTNTYDTHLIATSAAPTQTAPSISPELSVKLTYVLNDFLTSLEHEVAIKEKVSAIRSRLEQGLNSALLIPTLETLRNLVMEAYLAANQAFALYLQNVNQELADIYSSLGGAVQSSAQERAAARQLQADMMREMQHLETSSTNATDLNQLKNQVKSQLGNIRQAINSHQQTDSAQDNLAQQLHTLGTKIKVMELEAEKNRTTLETHRHKALHDPLTELPNREAYNERAQAEVQRWERYHRPLCLAIFDIDLFKNINDNYGHQAGDRVLKVIGRSIAKRLREVDFFCRYGGEEFVALLPETTAETALDVLDKIRVAIANASFNYKEQPIEITVSVGISSFNQNDKLEDVFERADRALYNAKSSGRNCTRVE